MRIKNWKRHDPHGNCWKLNISKTKPIHLWRSGVEKLIHTKICYRLGYSGDWVLMSEWKILKRAKTMTAIYKKAIAWMRKHPNG